MKNPHTLWLSVSKQVGAVLCISVCFGIAFGAEVADAAPVARRSTPKPTFVPSTEQEEGFSQRIDNLFNRAVAALHDGRADDFRSMLSSSTIERETRGADAIDKIIRTRFIPYFSAMSKLTTTSASVPTQDPEGHKGIALARSFVTESGKEHSFIMYIVEEDGELVVSNILLDKTLSDRLPK
jgi:hypothetical protein